MNEYQIHPWDTEDHPEIIDLDMWVPPEIDELATEVIACYDMKVNVKTLITAKSDKGGAIWKIETDKGPRSLKVLHRKPARSLFSVGAQDYIVKQGGRVPELKQTQNGLLYVEKGGKLWIVTDWIEPLTPANNDLEGAQALCYGLGEFHKRSKGYAPPPGSKRASRLYRWPDYYRKVISKFNWFRSVAQAYHDLPSSQLLLSTIDVFEREAHAVVSVLEQSSYAQMVAMGEEHWGLVHQDFGWSNGQLGAGGLWVIDLDGVSYDLPIRDLRKLISSTMFDLGKWDVTWIQGMINAYHSANPLDLETYEILLNDLAFPNEFYKHIKEMLYDPQNFLNLNVEAILQRLTLVEQTKGQALATLKLDKDKFKTGNYASIPVSEPEILQMMQMKATKEKTTLPSLIEENSLLNSTMVQDGSSLKKKTHKKNKLISIERGKSSGGKDSINNNRDHQLKILMICTEKLPVPPVRGGAIQTYIQGISGKLGQKHDLTILGTTDSSLPLDETRDNIKYVRIDGQQIFEIYAEKVLNFLRDESFDLIHVFNRPRLIPLIREVAPHSRLILSMHNDMFNSNKILHADALSAIAEVECIVTVSDYVGNTISNLYPQAAEKVQTIYSGVNLEDFVPWETSNTAAQIRQKLRKENNLEDKTVILFVGRLTPKKGTDLLIQALKEAHSSNPKIALVIVGGTWYSVDRVTDYVAYIRALAERAPFPVITTGYVSADNIHQWFWAGDIFVCPSEWQEPLARVHYEAMAAGLPFITTARGGNPEVVIDENGLVVQKPEDPVEFAEKITILLSDPKLRQRMGQTGRRLAEERFGWERVAQEVLETWKLGASIKTNLKNDRTELMTSESLEKAKLKDKGKVKSKVKMKKIVEIKVNDTDSIKRQEEVCVDLENLSSAVKVSSNVVKITRDIIFPMSYDHDLVYINTPSKVSNFSSVVKVTSAMIRR
ncbi:CotS family spore coat protein [Desulfosporosinus nitroreducens]|uniref:CotS family spore coat protein n=1 Tax=Desulfosporosinus nitroreducens TaxID=2018668 RepID=UPI00207D421D|nr:CotS family spore coat protein [Desulfosporosinus nitroreducens]MCO1604147.1 CotS family spore coat protein [Desulfosporosinus nitroreducens]